MIGSRALYSPPPVAVLAEVMRDLPYRCRCPICARLDARFPDEGYQLALFAYRLQTKPLQPVQL